MRGYSICYRVENNKIIRDASLLKVEDKIKVQFYKGSIAGSVEQVQKEI